MLSTPPFKPQASNSSLEKITTFKTETYAPKSPIFLGLIDIMRRAKSTRITSPLKNEVSLPPARCDISEIGVVITAAKLALTPLRKK
jgi:hypothetical protein